MLTLSEGDLRQNITVITNSLAVFQQLQTRSTVHLILTGGEYQADLHALTEAEQTIRSAIDSLISPASTRSTIPSVASSV